MIKMTRQEWKDAITMHGAFLGMGSIFAVCGFWQVLALIAAVEVVLWVVLSAVWHLIE